MWCGYLEQVERGAHCVVDADEDGDVGQSPCSKAVFGLPVERLVDTVSGGKLPRQLCGDLLVLTEVIRYSTACQHPDGQTAPTARITTSRSRGLNDVCSHSPNTSSADTDVMAGLSSAGLKGPMNRPSSVVLWKPVSSAHGTTVLVILSKSSRCAPTRSVGSARGRRPPKGSV